MIICKNCKGKNLKRAHWSGLDGYICQDCGWEFFQRKFGSNSYRKAVHRIINIKQQKNKFYQGLDLTKEEFKLIDVYNEIKRQLMSFIPFYDIGDVRISDDLPSLWESIVLNERKSNE